MINRGGEKIYPREIEEFLLTQPGVRSAVVVAASDEVLGQRPVAYVVPAGSPEFRDPPDLADLADALREACSTALPRPKRPSSISSTPGRLRFPTMPRASLAAHPTETGAGRASLGHAYDGGSFSKTAIFDSTKGNVTPTGASLFNNFDVAASPFIGGSVTIDGHTVDICLLVT